MSLTYFFNARRTRAKHKGANMKKINTGRTGANNCISDADALRAIGAKGKTRADLARMIIDAQSISEAWARRWIIACDRADAQHDAQRAHAGRIAINWRKDSDALHAQIEKQDKIINAILK